MRAITRICGLRLMVAWMLTPDDGSTDGKFVSYLEHPGKFSHHDPVLFQKIKELLTHGLKRRVSLIENTNLLPKTEFFSSHVPDTASSRSMWFSSLIQQAQGSDFVFLDPDNGLEVKSKAYGKKDSSKFLYWCEVETLWASGKSLLIYQHFIREKRLNFVRRMLDSMKDATPGSSVEAFSTPHVVFLMALQPEHQGFHKTIVSYVQKNWEGQIHHWELMQQQQSEIPCRAR